MWPGSLHSCVRTLTHWLAYFSFTSVSCFRNSPCSYIFQPSGRQVQVGIMFLLSRQVWESWSQTGSLAAARCLFQVMRSTTVFAVSTGDPWGGQVLYLALPCCSGTGSPEAGHPEGRNCLSFSPLSTIVFNPGMYGLSAQCGIGKERILPVMVEGHYWGVRSGLQLFYMALCRYVIMLSSHSLMIF